MHSSGSRLGISSKRRINRQRGRVQILSFFNFIRFYFIYLFILPSGGGSVPFVHPRKYAPDLTYIFCLELVLSPEQLSAVVEASARNWVQNKNFSLSSVIIYIYIYIYLG